MPRRLIATAFMVFALFTSRKELRGQEGATPEGRTISIDGAELYYEVHGDGPPLLLLHQFGSSIEVWRPFLPEFAKRYRVIAIDARGHGRSTNRSGQFSHRQAGLDLLAVLDGLGLQRVRAVGASLGAMTLLHASTRRPDSIEAMVLVGGTPYFPEEFRAALRAPDCGELTPERWQHKRKLHFLGDDQIRAIERHFCALADVYDDVNFTPPQLSTIRARTLIVHGDQDSYFPVRLAFEMYEAIPQSNLWVIPKGGHLPIFGSEERPAFERTVLAFLEESNQGT